MDAFDGDSDLSDVSAPPTPGPAATPRAASPEPTPAPAPAPPATETTPASPPPITTRRLSKRVAEAASAAAHDASTPAKSQPASKATSSTKAEPATSNAAGPSTETPKLARRASTRDRRTPAKLRSRSPSADQQVKASPKSSVIATAAVVAADSPSGAVGDTPKTKIKVTLSRKAKTGADDSGSSRGAAPQSQPASAPGSARKVTSKKYGSKTKLADDLRDLADDDDEEKAHDSGVDAAQQDAPSEDEFVPDQGVASKRRPASAKRDRSARSSKAEGRRRAIIADDEDEDDADDAEGPKAPQRKRAKLAAAAKTKGAAAKGSKPKSGRGGRTTVDYSSDDDDDGDEEMVDAASDEEDLIDAAAAALDSGDEFDEGDGPTRSGKGARKGRDGVKKVAGGRASGVAAAASKASATAASKKAGATGTTSLGTSGSSKAMSAEARMRASIDAAKDKSLKPPSSTKLNPQASAFRPGSSALKPGPGGGASTPTGGGRPGSTTTPSTSGAASATGVKRPSSSGGKPAFGKSMSGWDQLFGGLSGLSSSSPKSSTPSKPSAAGAGKASTPASATGIRPDPRLEAATPADMQRLKQQATQSYLSTDECFDLLAHADIMAAFERSVYVEDRKLAARLRPAVWKAGAGIVGKQGQH